MNKLRIAFKIEIDEANDDTSYHVYINETNYATIRIDAAGFLIHSTHDTIGMMMEVIVAAWNEFERRDSWSEFEFELEL